MLRDGKTHVDGHEERLVVLKLRRSIAALWAKKIGIMAPIRSTTMIYMALHW